MSKESTKNLQFDLYPKNKFDDLIKKVSDFRRKRAKVENN